MSTIAPERRRELAALFPLGAHLTITDPWPVAGEITDHGEHGLKLTKADGLPAFVSWAALAAARVERSAAVTDG